MSELLYQTVRCRVCGKEYLCTPEDDFYPDDPQDPQVGVCFSCLLRQNGLDPETTPVLVIDAGGNEIDPRDNT